MEKRKVADCRLMPNESNCQMTMIGPEEDLLDAAVDHAVSKHGHERSPKLREGIKTMLKDEE